MDIIDRINYNHLRGHGGKPECRICHSPMAGTEREWQAERVCADCYDHHLPKLILVPKRREPCSHTHKS